MPPEEVWLWLLEYRAYWAGEEEVATCLRWLYVHKDSRHWGAEHCGI